MPITTNKSLLLYILQMQKTVYNKMNPSNAQVSLPDECGMLGSNEDKEADSH